MALMRISREAIEPDCIIKVLVVEFVCTFLFVFVGVASAMTAGLLSSDPLLCLFLMGTAQAFAVAVMMSTGSSISGGHLNPAVTLGLAVIFRSILYCIDQCVASAAACFLLHYLTGGLVEIPVYTLAVGMSSLQGILISLLFTVYTTIVEPKKGSLDGLGSLLTGLVVGANIFAGGIYSGASMNPARSFGPALVSGFWTDHWVYWVGPFVGGGLAGLIYNKIFISRSHVVLPREDEARSVLAAATLT